MTDPGELLALVAEQSGLELGGFDPAVLRQRLEAFLARSGFADLGALLSSARVDEAVLADAELALCARQASLFGEPALWASLRDHVLPRLRTYPSIQIWHPRCGTGEEAYSSAILLHEAGLLGRARVYATEISAPLLAVAGRGRYAASSLADAEPRYRAAGGRACLDEYFQVEDDGLAVVRPLLRERVSFLEHNLATDGSPNEFQLIVDVAACQELGAELRSRALSLFHDSLCRSGFVALGQGESLAKSPAFGCYAMLDQAPRVWRRAQ